ncbi:MAG: L,D-transpeptidase family protein [Humidesulfovibrio sp.]|nr:L,D-transpeptidase family protein [Humidesulfovibrio sp.]
MKTVRTLFLLAGFILAPALAFAAGSGWETHINSQPTGPELFLGIDKENQTFYMFGRKSPLEVLRKLTCTTGQDLGDKTREGDKKTPEGVYFVEEKVPGKLDFTLYGNYAFSLNFPNPVDRLKGKTGHGIWIHGRGKQLVSRDTRGCVALTADDIKTLDGKIPSGTPVIIAKKLTWSKDAQTDATAQHLAERVRQWASDWQNKRERFFDYFQPEKFAQTEGVSFASFKAHKESIFARQSWINVMVDNVHVIQGPDYWVTTFDQFYRTQDLISSVGKRFYWQKDKDGSWRIVGGEYAEAAPDKLETRYLNSKRGEVDKLLKGWMEAWLSADIDKYIAYYAEDATNGKQSNAKAIRDYKKALWASKTPVRIAADKVEVAMHQKGLKVSFTQTYEDSTGHSDKGPKTLILSPKGDGWVIESENWGKS